MNTIFKKLAVAITFSPTGLALLKEAIRLKELFSSDLVLIHSGKRNEETEKRINNIIIESNLDPSSIEFIWTKGNPAETIIDASAHANVDLLIAGALEKESTFKYYIGSVARNIMRGASCSVLILKSISEKPIKFRKFCISTDYSLESENAIKLSYQIAELENADEFIIIHDFYTPGLSSINIDSNTNSVILSYQKDEEEKMNLFIRELNLKGVLVNSKCLFGREGWEEGNYVRSNNIDLFIVNSRSKKFYFFDRLFPNDLEYTFKNLPSNLLIIK